MCINNYGESFRYAREKNGMTQQELADAVNLMQSQISEIENGTKGTNPETLAKICSVLNISLDEIYSLNKQQSNSSPTEKEDKDEKEEIRFTLEKVKEGKETYIKVPLNELIEQIGALNKSDEKITLLFEVVDKETNR